MRSISILVTCDICQGEIEEEAEGASTVLFTVRGEEREMDLCDDCLYGTFLQEARPVPNRKKRKSPKASLETLEPLFACDCGKSFKTKRGLTHHQTAMHG